MAADQTKDSDEVAPIDSSEDKTEEIKEEASVEKFDKSMESMESHEQETKNRQRRQAEEVSKLPTDLKLTKESVKIDDDTSESSSDESTASKVVPL